MDPIKLMAMASAASSAVQAVGAMQEGKAKQEAHEYNAAVNDRNAEAERINAERVEFIETAKVERFKKKYQDFANAQRMAFAYNNIVADTGTALDVQLASAREADQEIASNIYNIKLGKQAREESALNQELEGNLQRMYGTVARRAGMMRAGQSLLSGAANYGKIMAFA